MFDLAFQGISHSAYLRDHQVKSTVLQSEGAISHGLWIPTSFAGQVMHTCRNEEAISNSTIGF